MKIGTFHLQVDTDEILLPDATGALAVYTGSFPVTINNVTIEEPSFDESPTNYTVILTDYSKIVFQSVGAFLNIRIEGHKSDFKNTAVGLVGDYALGKARDRNGNRFTTLGSEFPQEWQVDPNQDPLLFKVARAPQLPTAQCIMPGTSSTTARRRLRALVDTDLRKAAAKACEHKKEYDNCFDDILATGELGLAKFY